MRAKDGLRRPCAVCRVALIASFAQVLAGTAVAQARVGANSHRSGLDIAANNKARISVVCAGRARVELRTFYNLPPELNFRVPFDHNASLFKDREVPTEVPLTFTLISNNGVGVLRTRALTGRELARVQNILGPRAPVKMSLVGIAEERTVLSTKVTSAELHKFAAGCSAL